MIPLPSSPDYQPFIGGEFRLAMGLMALDPADWIEIDQDHAHELAAKAALRRSKPGDIFAALPGSEAGAEEALALLRRHLTERFPEIYADDGRCLTNRLTGESVELSDATIHPLDRAARCVQEDLCLMEAGAEGYILTAGAVAFPSRWKLTSKIGLPMRAIHAPVTGYDEKLARPVDRFFSILKVDKPVWRLNWTLMDSAELHQPGGQFRDRRDGAITAANAGEKLWLRVERQTLRRLPQTGAILFTIRTYHRRLGEKITDAVSARDLAAAIRSVPSDMAAYKSLPVMGAAALEWLDVKSAT